MILNDRWAAYNPIQFIEDNFYRETVNYSMNFFPTAGACTENIEREWSKLKLLKNMKDTSGSLIQSHLEEYLWRSLVEGGICEVFLKIINEESEQYPLIT
ncbi:hypothetical protein RF11_08028 [Thelohanellus kitauei]|uniref:ISXO2-like transposase domain-containing protein n=1 Tax=Thelohanellus kitauei TaxID=669202 RepID=A0A0C2NDB3_THEKT|nr:hypothetical protein RF11_08028 [Thelohanellus kitauei]